MLNLEKQTQLRRLVNQIETNRDVIYFCGMVLTLLMAAIAGVWTYIQYPNLALAGGRSIVINYIFSPLVLGIINFLLVFFVGSLIATIISMTHTKRMKAFHVEVEFEVLEHKEIKVGQAHYLSGILGNHGVMIGQFMDKDKISYRDAMNVICYHYREYFTNNFYRNLSYKIQSINNKDASRTERQLLEFIKNNNQDVGFQNRFIGNKSILIGIATTMVPGEEKLKITFQSEGDYEFDGYDVEAIRVLMKYGDIMLQHLSFIKKE